MKIYYLVCFEATCLEGQMSGDMVVDSTGIIRTSGDVEMLRKAVLDRLRDGDGRYHDVRNLIIRSLTRLGA